MRKVIIVVGASGRTRRVQAIARWARALLPAAALVVTPADFAQVDVGEQDAITVNADDVASGPLSLVDAITKAAAGPLQRD